MAANRPLVLAQWLALCVPVALLAGAYFSQYVGGLYPCEMCWWQRYAHFVAVPFAVLGLVAPPRRAWVTLAALAILASGLIGAYHAGIEYGWWEGVTACSAPNLGGKRSARNADERAADPLRRGAMVAVRDLARGLQLSHIDRVGAGDLRLARQKGGAMTKANAHRMIRVDQAGEYGATRIYAGQLAVMGERGPNATEICGDGPPGGRASRAVRRVDRRARRSADRAPAGVVGGGFALGAATALIGPEAAMACTAAVEEEIDRHYTRQLGELDETDDEPELAGMIERFRDDERAHRDTALAAGAEQAPAYPLLSGAIRLGCRLAIRLSERI